MKNGTHVSFSIADLNIYLFMDHEIDGSETDFEMDDDALQIVSKLNANWI